MYQEHFVNLSIIFSVSMGKVSKVNNYLAVLKKYEKSMLKYNGKACKLDGFCLHLNTNWSCVPIDR